jgi:hypothetical protein
VLPTFCVQSHLSLPVMTTLLCPARAQLGSALADAALAADEKAQLQGMAVSTGANCSDHTSHSAEAQKSAGMSLEQTDPSVVASATIGLAPDDCEAQLPSSTPITGVEFTHDDNDPHSPARLSEWETSLIVMGIGALVRSWNSTHSTH